MTSAEVIFNAAQRHIEKFNEEFYDPNMRWLLEVQQNALKIFSNGRDILLPRTPCAKRKFVDVEKANACHKESTCHEGAETKKLKIDDLSTIIDNSIIELSCSQGSLNNTRALRPRKQKNTLQANRPKRVPTKKKDVKPIVISPDFIPPSNIDHVTFQAPNMDVPSTNSTLQIKGPQTKTAIKITDHQTPSNVKQKNLAMTDGQFFKSSQCHINFGDTDAAPVEDSTSEIVLKDTVVKDDIDVTAPPSSQVNDTVEQTQHLFASTPEQPKAKPIESTLLDTSFIPIEKDILDAVNSGMSPLIVADTPDKCTEDSTSIETKDLNETPSSASPVKQATDPPIEESPIKLGDTSPQQIRADANLPEKPSSKEQAEESPEEVKPTVGKEGSKTVESFNVVEVLSDVKESKKDTAITSPHSLVSPKKPKHISPGKSPRKPKVASPQKPGKSPPKKTKLCNDDKENVMEISGRRDTYNVVEETGRRDTYKTMVDSIIDGPAKKPPLKTDGIKPMAVDKDVKKVPKVTKQQQKEVVSGVKSFVKYGASPKKEPVHSKAAGNMVTNVKSAVKQPSPCKEQPGGQVARKAAELEKKELMRQNAIKEGLKKKQKQIEEKRRLREEREKLLAEQLQKRQEETEKKRLQLELKEAQIAKNQEEIRRTRELEEKQKRELRDAKKAGLDARRQREEEESRRKAEELLLDEKRKHEIMQKKLELDEQKRKKKIAEKEMLEKDKLRLVEEYRMIDEERKKKVFEEKEKHRLDVIKKKEGEREKERLERQVREEKNRQAEREIQDSKRREEERQKAKEEEKQRAKEKLREEIKGKLQLGYAAKAVIDVPSALRASPRLKDHTTASKGKFNQPAVPLVQRDSIYRDYCIDELNSDDSTDDESQPVKRIPSWAVGTRLKKQLHRQYYSNIDPDDIFINCMEPLHLEKIFKKNKKIYFTRSSSAHWDSPPLKGTAYKFH